MNHGSKHMWLMVLACVVPLLAIFVLPLIGIKANITWIALGLMVVLHLWMMRGMHRDHGTHTVLDKQTENSKKDSGNSTKGGTSHGRH